MITGNETWKTKIATKAAAARTAMPRVRSARFPIRMHAAATIPTTAAWSPKNSPSTAATSPCAAYVHDSPQIRKNAGRMKAIPARMPPRTLCNSQPT